MAELPAEVVRHLSNIMDEALKIRMAAQVIKEQLKSLRDSLSYNDYRNLNLPATLDNGYTGSAEVLALGSLHGTELLLKALNGMLPKK